MTPLHVCLVQTGPQSADVSIGWPGAVAPKSAKGHVASLRSVALPLWLAVQVPFWIKVRQRFATLCNRLADEKRLAILTEIDARIPMLTAEDQEAAKDVGWEANAALLSVLRDSTAPWLPHRREAEREAEAAEAIERLEAANARRPKVCARVGLLTRKGG